MNTNYFFEPTQPKSFALPVWHILKPVGKMASPLAVCSTKSHCPHNLRTSVPPFSLQVLTSLHPSVPRQGHPHILLWLMPHAQSAPDSVSSRSGSSSVHTAGPHFGY